MACAISEFRSHAICADYNIGEFFPGKYMIFWLIKATEENLRKAGTVCNNYRIAMAEQEER